MYCVSFTRSEFNKKDIRALDKLGQYYFAKIEIISKRLLDTATIQKVCSIAFDAAQYTNIELTSADKFKKLEMNFKKLQEQGISYTVYGTCSGDGSS